MEIRLYIVAILAVSSMLTMTYAIYGLLRFRRVQGGFAYIGLMVFTTLYSAGYAYEICNDTLPGIYLALRIEYLGIASIPACILLLALQYNDVVARPSKWLIAGLFAIPLVTIVLLNTNEWHHLYYASLGVDRSGLFPVAAIKAGPWYIVQVVYYNIAFGVASVLYVRSIVKDRGFFTKQAAALFMTASIPWVSYWLYLSGHSPFGMDTNPLGIALTGPFMAMALFRYRMFDLVPVAYNIIVRDLPNPVLVVDTVGRLVEFNRAAGRAFSCLHSRVVGTILQECISVHPELLSVLRCGTSSGDSLLIKHDGEDHWYQWSMAVIGSKQGGPAGKVFLFNDVTAQRTLQMELIRQRDELDDRNRIIKSINQGLEAQVTDAVRELREREELMTIQGRYAAIGEYMDFVVHQWKQHLYALSLFAGGMRRRVARHDAITNSDVDMFDQQLAAMNTVLRDFRNFVNPGQGVRVIFNARDAIEMTLSLIQDQLNVKGITVIRNFCDEAPVYGFPNELSQVVLNIIDNACKVCVLRKVSRPIISLCLMLEHENAIVSIHDNGGGFDAGTAEHIFDKFHTGTGGAGLGLYISRMIIVQHFGGSISARNDHEGAVFEISIPLVQN